MSNRPLPSSPPLLAVRCGLCTLQGTLGVYLIFSKGESELRSERKIMRGATKLPVQSIIKQISPMTGTWRMMTVTTPQGCENNELQVVDRMRNVNMIEPLVAFDKPRMPPVLGPLIIFSLLETSSSNRDDK